MRERDLKRLKVMARDYEHCCKDEGGSTDPWRTRLIKSVWRIIRAEELRKGKP